jgi:hypothetical protein
MMAKKNGHLSTNQGLAGLAKSLGLPCSEKHPSGCGHSLCVSNIVKVDGYKPLFASAQLHLGRPCEGLAWSWIWLCFSSSINWILL